MADQPPAPPAPRTGAEVSRDTSQRLIDAAGAAFAARGVQNASLLDITTNAGQRNRGAVHYHFGSREQLVVAVLAQHTAFWSGREEALLRIAEQDGDPALRTVLEAMVRPGVELAESREGRCHLAIVKELLDADPATLSIDLRTAIEHAQHVPSLAMLRALLLRTSADQVGLATGLEMTVAFIRSAIADRARLLSRGDAGAELVSSERFVQVVTSMAVAILEAPAEIGDRLGAGA